MQKFLVSKFSDEVDALSFDHSPTNKSIKCGDAQVLYGREAYEHSKYHNNADKLFLKN